MKKNVLIGLVMAVLVLLFAWALGVKAAFAADMTVEFRALSGGQTALYVTSHIDSLVTWQVQASDLTNYLHHSTSVYTPTGFHLQSDAHLGAPCQATYKICGSCQRDAIQMVGNFSPQQRWTYTGEVTRWDTQVIANPASAPNIQGVKMVAGQFASTTNEIIYTDYSPSCTYIEDLCRPDCEADMGKPAQSSTWGQVKSLMR